MSATSSIPYPAELPTPWEQPDDEGGFWHMDRMHFPLPITMLDYEVTRILHNSGMNHGFTTYDMPLRADTRRFWTHHYGAVAPLMLPEEDMAEMGKRSEEKYRATMGQLKERWDTQWLPEIKDHIDFWRRFDLHAATMPDLLDHLDETILRFTRLWEIHFEIVFPSMLPISTLDEFYRDLFGSDNAFGAYQLLQGFDNLTLKTDRELWTLSRRAHDVPEVRAIFEERAALDVLPALEASAKGRVFLEQLRTYLDEYGQRGPFWGVGYPSLIEDPAPVIKNLKDYVTQPDRDPDLELAGLAAEREQCVATVREQLQSYPEAVRGQFEFLLKAAQEGIVLTEDHGFWIDFRGVYRAREVFKEFGRRFADAGTIETVGDVFHLTFEEIRKTAEQLPALDRRSLVSARKAEIDQFQAFDLPNAIGTQPPGPPPVNPSTLTTGKFFGVPPKPSTDPNVLNGASGSPGVVRGTARIARSLADAARLKPGDILVAETTAPPWTPLFATVAAVVTDTGGVLSHCAVVAREYRIPAVVGVGDATTRIMDGQTIEVDGDRGVVRIVHSD